MSKIIKIEVNQELVNYIQRLQYDKDSREEVIATLIENHKGDNNAAVLESAVFKTYQKQFSEARMEYELAKSEITKEYIPQCLEGHQYEWNLDFTTNELKISVYCECGIAAVEKYYKGKENDSAEIIIQEGE